MVEIPGEKNGFFPKRRPGSSQQGAVFNPEEFLITVLPPGGVTPGGSWGFLKPLGGGVFHPLEGAKRIPPKKGGGFFGGEKPRGVFFSFSWGENTVFEKKTAGSFGENHLLGEHHKEFVYGRGFLYGG